MSRAPLYPDQIIYIISVLWCHGSSESEIAMALRVARLALLSKGQISGIINRACEGQLRGLERWQRQEWLGRFSEHRFDGGYLADRHFIAKEK